MQRELDERRLVAHVAKLTSGVAVTQDSLADHQGKVTCAKKELADITRESSHVKTTMVAEMEVEQARADATRQGRELEHEASALGRELERSKTQEKQVKLELDKVQLEAQGQREELQWQCTEFHQLQAELEGAHDEAQMTRMQCAEQVRELQEQDKELRARLSHADSEYSHLRGEIPEVVAEAVQGIAAQYKEELVDAKRKGEAALVKSYHSEDRMKQIEANVLHYAQEEVNKAMAVAEGDSIERIAASKQFQHSVQLNKENLVGQDVFQHVQARSQLELDKTRREISEARRVLAAEGAELMSARHGLLKLEEAEQELQLSEAHRQQLQERVQHLLTTQSRPRAEEDSQTEEMKHLAKKCELLQKQLIHAHETSNMLSEKNQELHRQKEEAVASCAKAQAELEQASNILGLTKGRSVTVQSQASSPDLMEMKLSQLRAEKSEIEQEKQDCEAKLHRVEAQLLLRKESHTESLHARGREISELKEHLSSMQQAAVQERQHFNDMIQQLQDECSCLISAKEEVEAELERCEIDLDEAHRLIRAMSS